MKCPRCDYVSLPGSSFCEKCGTSLKAPSPRRSSAGPSRDARVAPAPAPRPVPAPAPAPAPAPRPASGPPPTPAPPPPAARPIPPIPAPAPRAAAAAPAPPPPPDPAEELKRRAYAALEAVEGGRIFYIDKDVVQVGRTSPADGILPEVDLSDFTASGTVSRRHARLVHAGEEIVLEDLGSSNGTFINGERLLHGVQKPIGENDELRFGAIRFVFHWRKKGRT